MAKVVVTRSKTIEYTENEIVDTVENEPLKNEALKKIFRQLLEAIRCQIQYASNVHVVGKHRKRE